MHPTFQSTKKTYIFTTVKQKGEAGRIWIEGKRLLDAGFKKGQSYNLSLDKDNLTGVITLSNEGKKKISGKSRFGEEYPIIDLCNKDIAEVFGNGTLLKIKISENQITLTPHKIESNKKEREERLLNNLSNKKPLKEGSLCTGGGISTDAIHRGLNASGVRSDVEMMVEMDSRYLHVALRNFPETRVVIEGKIEEAEWDDIPKLDILSFSLPCTGHSPLGKTSNKIKNAEEHPTATTSIFGALEFIKKSNPSILISENVVQAQNSATYTLLKAELDRLGYEIKEFILNGEDAGSIEKRTRYWFVAYSKGLDFLSKISPTTFDKKFKNIESIIDQNVPFSEWFSSKYFDKRQEAHTERGRGFRKNFVLKDDEFVNVIPRLYSKRQISNPHYIEGDKIRLFTVEEHARIKGIPESLVLDVSKTVGHEILGQSILYNHAYGLALSLGRILNQIKQENREEWAS